MKNFVNATPSFTIAFLKPSCSTSFLTDFRFVTGEATKLIIEEVEMASYND